MQGMQARTTLPWLLSQCVAIAYLLVCVPICGVSSVKAGTMVISFQVISPAPGIIFEIHYK